MSHGSIDETPKGPWGMMISFDEPETLLEAVRKAKAAGYSQLETYTPFPVHELDEEMNPKRTKLPMIILIAGLTGCIGGFFMQWYANVISYPWNVGGRPFNSWPSFMPVTFELTVLCAAIAAVVGMISLNGLPEPYHPVFNVDAFEDASRDKFFLCIEATDVIFDSAQTRKFLDGLGGSEVYEVAP